MGARSTLVGIQWNRWGNRNRDRCVGVVGGYLGALQGAGMARIGPARAGVQGKDSIVREGWCGEMVETGASGRRNLAHQSCSLGMRTGVVEVVVMAFVGIGSGSAESNKVVPRCYMTAK